MLDDADADADADPSKYWDDDDKEDDNAVVVFNAMGVETNKMLV